MEIKLKEAKKNFLLEADRKILIKIPKDDFKAFSYKVNSFVTSKDHTELATDEEVEIFRRFLDEATEEQIGQFEKETDIYRFGLALIYMGREVDEFYERILGQIHSEKKDKCRNADLVKYGEERLFKYADYELPALRKNDMVAREYIREHIDVLRQIGFGGEG